MLANISNVISNMSETTLHSVWPHLTYHFLCQKGWDEMLCLTVCLFYFFVASVGGCRHRRGALHRWQSLLRVCTLLSICAGVYLGVAWKTRSLLALCCFFSSSHTHAHIHTHTGCIFSWLGGWDCLWAKWRKRRNRKHCLSCMIRILVCYTWVWQQSPCSVTFMSHSALNNQGLFGPTSFWLSERRRFSEIVIFFVVLSWIAL